MNPDYLHEQKCLTNARNAYMDYLDALKRGEMARATQFLNESRRHKEFAQEFSDRLRPTPPAPVTNMSDKLHIIISKDASGQLQANLTMGDLHTSLVSEPMLGNDDDKFRVFNFYRELGNFMQANFSPETCSEEFITQHGGTFIWK